MTSRKKQPICFTRCQFSHRKFEARAGKTVFLCSVWTGVRPTTTERSRSASGRTMAAASWIWDTPGESRLQTCLSKVERPMPLRRRRFVFSGSWLRCRVSWWRQRRAAQTRGSCFLTSSCRLWPHQRSSREGRFLIT